MLQMNRGLGINNTMYEGLVAKGRSVQVDIILTFVMISIILCELKYLYN